MYITTNFTFYADQGLFLLNPPFSICIQRWNKYMLKCDPQSGKIVLFLCSFFVCRIQYVHNIYSVIIHMSPEMKLAVVRATRVVYTIVFISCKTSDQQRVLSYIEFLFNSANIPGIYYYNNTQMQLIA